MYVIIIGAIVTNAIPLILCFIIGINILILTSRPKVKSINKDPKRDSVRRGGIRGRPKTLAITPTSTSRRNTDIPKPIERNVADVKRSAVAPKVYSNEYSSLLVVIISIDPRIAATIPTARATNLIILVPSRIHDES